MLKPIYLNVNDWQPHPQGISGQEKTRPAWAGFKTAEEGIAIIMSYIL